jgi:hypothetical protein
MVRIFAWLKPDQPKKDEAAAMDEYTSLALDCGAVQIGKQPGVIKLTFKFATACVSAILKKAYRDDRIERIDTEAW